MNGGTKLVKDTLLLGATNLALNAANLLLQIWLAARIGKEGVGLYALIGSVYLFATTFAVSGISLSTTRIVTETMSRNGSAVEVPSRMRQLLAFCAGLGTAAGVLLFLLAPAAGRSVSSDARIVLCFYILAPALPFMSLTSCFGGFFLAERKAIKTAAVAAGENLFELALIVFLFLRFPPQGAGSGCVLLATAKTASEGMGALLSFLLYRKKRNGLPPKTTPKPVLREFVRVGGPVAAGSYLRSGLTTLENLLIPVGLMRYGFSENGALALVGTLKGLVLPALFFPSAILGAFTRVLVPEITDAFFSGRRQEIDRTGERILGITASFAAVVWALFAVFSRSLSLQITGDAASGIYFRLLAPLIPLMYLDGVVDGILKGMDEQFAVARFSLYESALRVLTVWLILPHTGTAGFLLTLLASNSTNAVLSLRHLLKKTNIRLHLWRSLLLPGLASLTSSLAVRLLFRTLLPVEESLVCFFGIPLALLGTLGLLRAAGILPIKTKNTSHKTCSRLQG